MKKIITLCLILLTTTYIYSQVDSPLYKVMVIYVVIAFTLPILVFYIKSQILSSVKESEKIKRNNAKHKKKDMENVNPYYLQTRNTFNRLMKERKLSREQILNLTDLIELCLAEHLKDYRSFRFNNDAQKIYTYLKNQYLNQLDYEKITKYLLQTQNNKGEII